MFSSNQQKKNYGKYLSRNECSFVENVGIEEQEDNPARLSCFDAQLVPF